MKKRKPDVWKSMRGKRALDWMEFMRPGHAARNLSASGFADVCELEPRVLFSGVPLEIPDASVWHADADGTSSIEIHPVGVQDSLHDNPADHFWDEAVTDQLSVQDWTIEPVPEQFTLLDSQTTINEIVFIDRGVDGWQSMVDEIQSSNLPDRITVIQIDSGSDGIQQISDALGRFTNVSAIHLISHGSNGQLVIGNSVLNLESLQGRAGEIAQWGSSLTEGADFLVYGCNLAGDISGHELLNSMAALTGADFAASDDLTGHESLGGDWDLEYQTGDLETSVIVNSFIQSNWKSVLIDVFNGEPAIWFSTLGDATDDAALSWTGSNAIQLGNPGLQLEPDFATSDGTIELTGFTAPVGIRGMHLVESTTITVGGTVLQRGDLLFAIDANHNFGGFTAERHDIILFRPNSANDYSTGTYSMFLDEGVHDGAPLVSRNWYNVHGLSLIEKDVTVGGTFLTAGTLVVAHSTPADHDNLYTINISATGQGTTVTSGHQLLLKGSGPGTNLNFADLQIQGIEVLEDSVTVGGTFIPQGSILLTLNTSTSQNVGGNSLNIQGEDIFYLTVTSTELTGGTVANATMLFQGIDVGLNSLTNEENLNGLTLVNSLSFVYTLTVDTTSDDVDGNTSSIAALLANKGSDGRISLREAILATNNTPNGATPDLIQFNIPDNDPGHFYYRNDGNANRLSLIVNTTLPDGSIIDFDPDYPYGGFSWFRINLNNALPQLSITDAVIIDGYSQPGATQNTLTVGHNAHLKIELTNSVSSDGKRGLTFDTGANGSTLTGLVINDFQGLGVLVNYNVNNVTIAGNFIGTDVSGTRDFGNGDSGIQIRSNNNRIGGSGLADRNLISGNNSRGISFFSGSMLTGNVVENNYIGVDATGIRGLGNNVYGIQLYNTDGTRIINNVISDNDEGIVFRSGSTVRNSVIQGNLIGVGADGTTLLGSGEYGIRIDSDVATNNLIGGSGAGQGNIIAGSDKSGIEIGGSATTSTIILGNFIGTNAAGILDLGNAEQGIRIIGSSGNTIGGVLAGEANTIAFNRMNGVAIVSGNNNSIRGNRIYGNLLRGIDLVGGSESNGVTANDLADVDIGANNLQNFPVLTGAVVTGLDITINATLDSNLATAGIIVDFYWSTSADVTGHGEASNYIGSVTVNTNALGNVTISQLFTSANVPVGAFVTATATGPGGSTSEFALNLVASGPAAAPVMGNNQLTINEGQTLVLDGTNFSATDTDSPDAGLVFNVSSVIGGYFALASNTAASITSFTQAQVTAGNIVFVDNGDETAPSYVVTVTDGGLSDGPYAGTINFTNVNDDPTVGGPVTAGASEDAAPYSVNLLSGASDAEGNTLNVSGLTLVSGNGGGISLSGNNLNITPGFYNFLAVGESAIVQYSYTIVDGNGGSVAQTATITITGQNDAPVVGAAVTATSHEDAAAFVVNLLAGASDPDTSDSLSITNLNLASGDASGISISGNNLNVNPNAYNYLAIGQSAVIQYTFDIIDGNGGVVSQTASITISGRNDAPAISTAITAGSHEDAAAYLVNLLTGASDADSSDTLTVTNLTLIGGDASGVSLSGNNLNVNPNAYNYLAVGQSAVVQYTFDIIDGNGGVVSQSATITISGRNDAPAAVNDSATTAEDVAVTFGVLGNDSDPDTLDVLSVSIVSGGGPANGTVVVNAGNTITYTPNQDYSGVDSFTYRISDGNGGTSQATVSLLINPVNDAPQVANHNYFVLNSGTLTGNVLTGSADVDGDPLSISLASGPASGTLVLNSDGTFVFTPAAGFAGTVTFQYLASDGTIVSGVGTATINVVLANPVVVIIPSDPGNDDDAPDTDAEILRPHITPEKTTVNVKPKTSDEFMSDVQAPEARLAEIAEQSRLTTVIVEPNLADMGILISVRSAAQESSAQFRSVVYGVNPLMFATLDHLEDQLDEVNKNIGLAFVASIVSLSGVSIGVVSWILRSGALVTSLLAQMPAWRIIDPLVVLGYMRDEDETAESVEDIIDAGESRTRKADNPSDGEVASPIGVGADTE